MSRERYFLWVPLSWLPAVATRWAFRATGDEFFVLVSFATEIAFLTLAMFVVLIEILRSDRVTIDTIFGGISV